RVLQRAVGLAHKLMHLRVRGEMYDEVDRRILDAVDTPAERRVVAGKILQQGREGIADPGVRPLVDTEYLVPVRKQPQGEIRADLAGRAGDKDPHGTQV